MQQPTFGTSHYTSGQASNFPKAPLWILQHCFTARRHGDGAVRSIAGSAKASMHALSPARQQRLSISSLCTAASSRAEEIQQDPQARHFSTHLAKASESSRCASTHLGHWAFHSAHWQLPLKHGFSQEMTLPFSPLHNSTGFRALTQQKGLIPPSAWRVEIHISCQNRDS